MREKNNNKLHKKTTIWLKPNGTLIGDICLKLFISDCLLAWFFKQVTPHI